MGRTTLAVPFGEKLAYGSITFSHGYLSGVVTTFLLYYYTDVLQLPLRAVTALLLAVRLFDGLIDPLIGYYMDTRPAKKGKYRRYIYLWALPFCLCTALLFFPMPLAGAAAIVWCAGVFLVWSLAFSMVECAALPMLVTMSGDPEERYSINSIKIVGGIVAVLAARYSLQLVGFFGGDSEKQGFFITMALASGVSLLAFLPARFIQERAVPERTTLSLLEAGKVLVRSKKLVLLFAFFLCLQMASSVKGQAAIFYMKYVVERKELTTLFMIAGTASSLLMQPVIAWLAKRIRLPVLTVTGLLGAAAGMLVVSAAGPSVPTLFLGNILYGLMMAIPNNLMFIYVAQCANIIAAQKGHNLSGTIHSLLGLASRAAIAVAGALISFVLYLNDYQPNTAQTTQSQSVILFVFIGLTVIFCVAAAGLIALSFRQES